MYSRTSVPPVVKIWTPFIVFGREDEEVIVRVGGLGRWQRIAESLDMEDRV